MKTLRNWLAVALVALGLPPAAWALYGLGTDGFQNQTSTTTSTTFADFAGSATAAALINGHDYLVWYSCGFGFSNNGESPEVEMLQGSTVLALARGEGRADTKVGGSGTCSGVLKVTGDGTNLLEMKHRLQNSGFTAVTSGSLVAMDLENGSATFTPNVDYFFDGTSSATIEQNDLADTWTTIRTVNFTLPGPTQDWIYCMSVEGEPGAGTVLDAVMVRFQIDGTTQGAGEYVKEWEANDDRTGFAYCDIANETAGSHTFRIQGRNRDTSANVDFYRSNIVAIKKSMFEQVKQTVDTAGSSGTLTVTGSTVTFLQTAYTPHQNEGVLAIASTTMAHSTDSTHAELHACLPAGGGCVFSSNLLNQSGINQNDDGLGSDDDLIPLLLVGTYPCSSGCIEQFEIRPYGDAAGTWTIGKNAGNTAGVRSNLILAGLTITGVVDPLLGNPRGGIVPSPR